MTREVEFNKEARCDNCGCIGAFDFMGDFLCAECMKLFIEPEDRPKPKRKEEKNGQEK